jgi:PAS domain S-box-containing protein
MLKTIQAEERQLTLAVLGLLPIALFALSRVDYLVFHGLVEMFGVVVGVSIFFLTLHARKHLENAALRLLGVAFLFLALLGLLHTLAYKGMGVFSSYGANLPTQLWVVLRLLGAGSFVVAPLLLGRRVSLRLAAGAYAVLTAALVWAVFAGHFPDCFVEGQGLTPFKIWSEFAAMLLFTTAGLLFHQRREHFEPEVMPLLLCSLFLNALAGAAFSVYVGIYDLSNFAGHVVVLYSVLCLHRAVFVTGVANPYALLSRKLREAEAQFRGIVENSAEGLFQTDRQGVILAANPAFAKALGYADATKAVGQPLSRHFPGGPQECQQVLGPALEGGKTSRLELAALRLDGSTVWLFLNARLAQGEEGARLNGSLRDISAQVRKEQLRKDVERILQHELRSPLSGIVGLGRFLGEDQTLPEAARDMGALIADTGSRVLRMSEESLALYRLEEGSYIPDLHPVNLPLVLERLRVWHQTLAERKDLDVCFLLDNEPVQQGGCLRVQADEQLLEHALSNLLKNALEAAPKGSVVTVRVESGEAVRLQIHNQGVVPEAVRRRFFERDATSGKATGTGLGTYIARLAVLAQGGDLSFSTSAQDGTTLHLTLPGAAVLAGSAA